MTNMLKALFALCLVFIIATPAFSEIALKDLTAGQKIASFETEAVYINQDGKRIGARFRHIPSRFVLDILRIQSLPQAFMWVNTPPPSDQGEPHTLEHLLLGKGTKGRYVASLEEMSLGSSSAFTQQMRTCYHFNTSAGSETFFNLFEAKLEAMIHPNYSDEEIRREVRNMGVVVNNEDGSKYLEEKGTVYNEMISSFERPWGNLYFNLLKNVYGDGHPLSYSAGGLPAAIRTMQPDDIRNFREAYYHLNNMGTVLSIGDEISLANCLSSLSKIFNKIEPNSKAGIDPAEFASSLPQASPQERGKITTVGFPHSNENEPGLLVYAWPPERDMGLSENLLFSLFVENLSSGQTSNLYKRFIDSQERLLDIGASSTFGWISDHPGQALFIGFSNVSRDATGEKMIDSVRSVLLSEIEMIASFADNSPELFEFNERLRSLSINNKREIKEFLNSPPRFGYRGSGSRWFNHLQLLKNEKGFERDVSGRAAFAFVEQMLDSKKNFWQEYIANWKLLSTIPFGIATHADPELLSENEISRIKRIDVYVTELQEKYKTDSKKSAIEIYEKEYAKNSAIIDAEAATIEMPSFVENPPLTLDDQLNYSVEKLPGGGDCVYSRFDNISSTTVGLVFDLYSVPESLLVFLPVLPTVMTQIGVIKDGQPISFDEMNQAIKREILGL
ncbi:MAG: insulinase family protein, partial [candidate division Zixibacteria bacterium]|nr:insulinase family protein [candidate division Zixibacteria bacterium]